MDPQMPTTYLSAYTIMLKQSALRKDLKKFLQDMKRHGDVIPEFRERKHSRTINNHVYETMEIPLSAAEAEVELNHLLTRHGSSKKFFPTGDTEHIKNNFMADETQYKLTRNIPEPEPTPVCLFRVFLFV